MSINKKITFIRHAECSSNVQKIFQSISDPLTEVGINQAKKWGYVLQDEGFDCVYSSTAVRTLQTLVYAVANGLNIPSYFNTESLMLEIDRGIYAGTIETKQARLQVNMITNTLTESPDCGESVIDVRNRVEIMRKRLIESPHTNILLVGHSGWLKYLIAQMQGLTPQDALQMKSLGHDQQYIIKIDSNKVTYEIR